MNYKLLIAAALAASLPRAAKAADSAASPLYQVTVVQPTFKAVDYERLNGSAKVDMRGTVLLPAAGGKAAVKIETGAMKVALSVKHLDPASKFDPRDLTYVLWAISPEGRAENLGELVLVNGSASLTATTGLHSFGLIVTAEPDFAVAQPGPVVVLENSIPDKSPASAASVDVKYEFGKRGQYTAKAAPADLRPVPMDKKTPFTLYEARNAVKIARAEGAETYAPDAFNKASLALQQAESDQGRRHWYSTKRRQVIQQSRYAVEAAEDARLLAMKRSQEEGVARQLSQAQEAASAAQAEARKQRELAQKAEEERAGLRKQLGAIFATRDTARGLIMNMPNAQFATGKAELSAPAREKLAKIAGIVLVHPGLKMKIEGHTDAVGGDAYNQRLSEHRADAVKDYLGQQGVPAAALTAEGFGKSKPIASNDTPIGRRQNRRVEIVVSGEPIAAQVAVGEAQPGVETSPAPGNAETAVQNWPGRSRTEALALMARYGQPAEVAEDKLVWRGNAPWSKTVLYREAPRSSGGLNDNDILEQSVAYNVPDAKLADLRRFDERVNFDKSTGELSSVSENEGLNYLALNLADEIVTGKRSPDDARAFYQTTAQLSASGKSTSYMDGLLFPVNGKIEPGPSPAPENNGMPNHP